MTLSIASYLKRVSALVSLKGKEILKVSKEALTLLAQEAFHDCEFMLRRAHNEQVAKILTDPEASENDKYVALQSFVMRSGREGRVAFLPRYGYGLSSMGEKVSSWTGFEDEEHSLVAFSTPLLRRTCVTHRTLL